MKKERQAFSKTRKISGVIVPDDRMGGLFGAVCVTSAFTFVDIFTGTAGDGSESEESEELESGTISRKTGKDTGNGGNGCNGDDGRNGDDDGNGDSNRRERVLASSIIFVSE